MSNYIKTLLYAICVLGLRVAKWAAVKHGSAKAVLMDAEGDARYQSVRNPERVKEFLKEIFEDPFHKHDCKSCKYLGSLVMGDELYDLYFCPTGGGKEGTVLARYDDEPEDYASGLPAADLVPALAEAKKRAIAKGYLLSDEDRKFVQSVW